MWRKYSIGHLAIPGPGRPGRPIALLSRRGTLLIVGRPLFNGQVTTDTGPDFTEADLLAKAGQRSFLRGQDYLATVGSLKTMGDKITAAVRGSDVYFVTLIRGGEGGLRGECDCPYGREGFFCKHCVAVGLTLLHPPAVPAQRGRGQPRRRIRLSRPHSWLAGLSREDLLDLVRERMAEDYEWRRSLELRAAGAAADLPGIKSRLDDLLTAGEFGRYGYIDAGEAWRYARRVREVSGALARLTADGQAAAAIAAAQYALNLMARSCQHAADPAGLIHDAAAELTAVHRSACAAAPADAAELADFLAERLLSGDAIPVLEIADYDGLLGKAGFDRIRASVTAAWQRNPAGRTEQHVLERLLRAAGDVDAVVALLAANLDPRGRQHWRIACELERGGRVAEALEWAERGLRAAADPDQQLADFVARRYVALGRIADALAVRRGQFEACRDLAAYQSLRATAEQAGDWPQTRQWAVGLLRADANAAARSGRQPSWPPTAPVLIDVLIAAGEAAAAWEAAPGIASEDQWLRLADLVAASRPADALAVYLRQIESLRDQSSPVAYQRMVRLLTAARGCHGLLGTRPVFDAYLRALRDDQKRKRKLIRILDEHQLAPEVAVSR